MLSTIRVFDDLETLSQAAADIFVEIAGQSIASRRRFSVALSGGNTPRRFYEILASVSFRDRIQWGAVHVFWGDERCVPESDLRSNARMARQSLLDHVPIPAKNIHPMRGELPPADAAAQYESELRQFFGDQPPVLDLVLLGLGDNAHTASLFPHTLVLDEKERWVSEVYITEQDMYRVTLTAPLINQAAQVVFLVSGAEKASALQSVLEGAYQPDEYPAQLIHPNRANPIWLVDQSVGHKLALPVKEDSIQ
jgi:6-phosphogluconolactonase